MKDWMLNTLIIVLAALVPIGFFLWIVLDSSFWLGVALVCLIVFMAG